MQCSFFFPLLLLLLLMFSYYLLGDARVVWCLPLDDRQSSIQYSCVFIPSFCGCGSFHSFGEKILMSTMNMNQFMNPPLFHTRQSHPVAEAAAMKKAIAHVCTHHLMGVEVSYDDVACYDWILPIWPKQNLKKKKKNALKMMSRHFQLFSHEIIIRVAKAGWVKDTVAQLSTVETRCALAGGGVRYIADQSAICDDMYVLL